jgi:hypothetical protein
MVKHQKMKIQILVFLFTNMIHVSSENMIKESQKLQEMLKFHNSHVWLYPSLCNDVAVVLPSESQIILEYTIPEQQEIILTCDADVSRSNINLLNSTIHWLQNQYLLNKTTACTETSCSSSMKVINDNINGSAFYTCILSVLCCNETVLTKCIFKNKWTIYQSRIDSIVKQYSTPNFVSYVIILAVICATIVSLVIIESSFLRLVKTYIWCYKLCCEKEIETYGLQKESSNENHNEDNSETIELV